MAAPTMPTTKMRRKNGWSTRMCMYQPATRKNFAAPIANRAMMIRFVWAVSMYETAISIAVSTTSTTAISTYCRGDGWCPSSETSTSVGVSAIAAGASAVATATAVPGVSVSVSAVSVMPVHSVLGDQVHGREDEDPYDVDEVPVETRDLHRFRPARVDLALERPSEQGEQPHDAHRHV